MWFVSSLLGLSEICYVYCLLFSLLLLATLPNLYIYNFWCSCGSLSMQVNNINNYHYDWNIIISAISIPNYACLLWVVLYLIIMLHIDLTENQYFLGRTLCGIYGCSGQCHSVKNCSTHYGLVRPYVIIGCYNDSQTNLDLSVVKIQYLNVVCKNGGH